jgi:DNA repair protein SbcD/Mre11
MDGSIVRMVLEYPVEWDALINESELRKKAAACFEFHLVRRPQREVRLRLPNDVTISSLTPLDLLDKYWRSLNHDDEEAAELQKLAQEVIHTVTGSGSQ